MTTNVKLLGAIAAVVAVVFVGYSLLPSAAGIGGTAPTPTPSVIPAASPSAVPTAAPSTSPSSSAVFPSWFTPESGSGGAGGLAAGSQATRSLQPGFTFSIPAGWVNSGDSAGFYGLFPDTLANRAEFARSGDLADSIHMGPVESPWFVCQAVEQYHGTAAEMTATAAANDALAMSKPVDVTIGGLTGKRFDVQRNPDWTGTCPPEPGDPPLKDALDERTRVFLLDAPGHGVIVIFLGSKHSADHEAFLAQAMPVVQSFDFTP